MDAAKSIIEHEGQERCHEPECKAIVRCGLSGRAGPGLYVCLDVKTAKRRLQHGADVVLFEMWVRPEYAKLVDDTSQHGPANRASETRQSEGDPTMLFTKAVGLTGGRCSSSHHALNI